MTTYAAPASPVAGGRYYWPSWRRGRAPMSVFAIPASNTLADLNPKNNPALNPVYPSTPEWMGNHVNVISAWCGACWGEDVGELWLPLSGGHADYAGNEPYKINLMADSPAWQMVRPPSGAIGNVLTTNDGQDATGVYSDGRARAIHSYNKHVWVPGLGPCVSIQGNTSWGGQNGPQDFLLIDRITGEATRATHSNIGHGSSSSGMGACYDPSRHAIWARGVGTGKFVRRDFSTGQWVQVGPSRAAAGYQGLAYLPGHDVLFVVNEYYANGFAVVACATGDLYTPGRSGTPIPTMTGRIQPVYVEELNAVAVWHNSSPNAHKIDLFEIPANPTTDAWTVSTLTFTDVDTVSSANANGTYGRFFFSKRLGGFGVLNATSQPIYFFAIR